MTGLKVGIVRLGRAAGKVRFVDLFFTKLEHNEWAFHETGGTWFYKFLTKIWLLSVKILYIFKVFYVTASL